LDKIAFIDIHPFLIKYVDSPAFKINDNFLNYLTSQCYNYPAECINIFERAINWEPPETDEDGLFFRGEDSITKFIIGAYTILRPSQVATHKIYQKKLMLAFDKILKDPRFRTDTEKVLERIIG